MYDVRIDFGKVILLAEKYNLRLDDNSKFRTRWMLIKGIEDKVFCLDNYEIDKQNKLPKEIQDKYIVVDLEKRLRWKIQNIIDKQFKILSQENNDYVLEYKEEIQRNSNGGRIGTIKIYEMLNESDLFGKNIRDDKYRTRYMSLDISEIDKGFIYPLHNESLKYDVLQDKFVYSDREVLKAIYNTTEVKQILTFEQYEKGLTPPIYNEIAKINNFIKDINTVTVELKNGTIFKAEATLRNILQVYSNGKIYVARTYHQKIIEGNNFENYQYLADEIKCIKFNRTELEINGSNLNMLNENIKKNTEVKVEEEETEEI